MKKLELERLTPDQTVQLDALLADTQGKKPSPRFMAKATLDGYRLWAEGAQPDEIGFWAHERDGEFAGFFHGSFYPSLGKASLNALAVAPEYRGKGIADKLVDEFLGRAAVSGANEVDLMVSGGNDRAKKLYEKHGFNVTEELVAETGRSYMRMSRSVTNDVRSFSEAA